MTTPVWVPLGLNEITGANALSQIQKNIAYEVEKYLQINDSSLDPAYSSRTSKQKKMVFLSNPPVTSPVYPVAVVSYVSYSGYAIALDPVRFDYTVQVQFVGKSSQQSVLENMVTMLIKSINDDRSILHDVGMYYTRDSVPATFQPFRRDNDNPKLIHGSVTFSFYSII